MTAETPTLLEIALDSALRPTPGVSAGCPQSSLTC